MLVKTDNRALALKNGALATRDSVGLLMEQVVLKGDLAAFTPGQRVDYVIEWCRSLSLNPLTHPFDILPDKAGKLTLYLNAGGAAQLRGNKHVDIKTAPGERQDDLYIVRATATMPDGRTDEDFGAVSLVKENGTWQTTQNGKKYLKGDGTYSPLQGIELIDAMKKALTQAKRRVTISILGLTNVVDPDSGRMNTVPAENLSFDPGTGEIFEQPTEGELVDAPEPDQAPPSRTITCANPDCGNVIPKVNQTLKGELSDAEFAAHTEGLCERCYRATATRR